MYKQLNGINTLGLEFPDKITSKEMFEKIWDYKLKNKLSKIIKEEILNNMYDDNYKQVDERLIPFIGVYPLHITCQEWVEKFKEMVRNAITVDYLIYQKKYQLSNPMITKGEFIQIREDIYRAIEQADYIKGITIDSYGRETKLLKYIKQQMKKIVIINDKEYDSQEFVKYYNKYKESSKELHLVITNSIASFLGMSSYAPKKGNNRLWTSCQSILFSGSGYDKCLPTNLVDKGSLIAYITDGTTINFLGYHTVGQTEDSNHQVMIARYIIRFLESNSETGKVIVAPDRAYHSSMYSDSVFNILAQLCKKNGYSLGIHVKNNFAQQEEIINPIEKYTNRNTKIEYADSLVPIKASPDITYDSGKRCSNCSHSMLIGCQSYEYCDDTNCEDCKFHDVYNCELCSNFNLDECAGKDCSQCENRSCLCKFHLNITMYTHYDDQLGCVTVNNKNYFDLKTLTFKYKYKLYVDVEDKVLEITNKFKKKEVV